MNQWPLDSRLAPHLHWSTVRLFCETSIERLVNQSARDLKGFSVDTWIFALFWMSVNIIPNYNWLSIHLLWTNFVVQHQACKTSITPYRPCTTYRLAITMKSYFDLKSYSKPQTRDSLLRWTLLFWSFWISVHCYGWSEQLQHAKSKDNRDWQSRVWRRYSRGILLEVGVRMLLK